MTRRCNWVVGLLKHVLNLAHGAGFDKRTHWMRPSGTSSTAGYLSG